MDFGLLYSGHTVFGGRVATPLAAVQKCRNVAVEPCLKHDMDLVSSSIPGSSSCSYIVALFPTCCCLHACRFPVWHSWF